MALKDRQIQDNPKLNPEIQLGLYFSNGPDTELVPDPDNPSKIF